MRLVWVVISLVLVSIIGIQTASALPYFDIMSFAFNPETIIVIGNVTDSYEIVNGLETTVKYNIGVETYLKNSSDKETIHTFSQPKPDGSRGGNNYSYFDIGDRVILVLHPPYDKNQSKNHPDTYIINSLVNPHHVEQQLLNIWSVQRQIEYLLILEPENFSDGYYKTRHSKILCNVGLKSVYKKTDTFASCVTFDTFEKLLQRGWIDKNLNSANDLEQNYTITLSTNDKQYSIGDNVEIKMKNNGNIPVMMKGGFGDLTLRNMSSDEFIKIWYSSDGDIRYNEGIRQLLMPDDERILERNLWDESKIEPGPYEISITYTIMDHGNSINVSSYTQFNVK